MKLCVCTFFYTAQVDTVYQIFLYNSCSIRRCFCDNWKPSFFHRLIFNWRTFSRWVAAHLWCQWAKNQVSTNQNSRNRWCQIVGGIICWLIRIGWRPSTIFIKMETLKQMFPWECWETPTSWNNSELLQKIDKKLARHIHCNHMLFWKFQINKSVLLIEIMKF